MSKLTWYSLRSLREMKLTKAKRPILVTFAANL